MKQLQGSPWLVAHRSMLKPHQPMKISIPSIMNEIATEYEFIGVTGKRSISTDILSLLLNMHDYNHQNGTHRELFEIEIKINSDRVNKNQVKKTYKL